MNKLHKLTTELMGGSSKHICSWIGFIPQRDYAKLFSGSNAAVIRVYDVAGTLIEVNDKGDFKEP